MTTERSRRWAAVVACSLLVGACGGDEAEVDPALARLAIVEDAVDVRLGDVVAYAPGAPGQDLDAGDDVRTGQPGFAEVAYRDGSLTRLDAGTEFEVLDLASADSGPVVDATLDVGRAWSRVRELTDTSRFEVETAHGVAAVRGTGFDVDCRDPEAAGCVFTLVQGALELTSEAGATVDLAELQRVTLAPDGTFGEVVQLTLGQVQQDPWLARNLLLDARRGFALLAEAPPAEEGGPATIVTDPPGFDDGQVRVRSGAVARSGEDTVTQTVVVGGPRTVRLAWRFCNAQVCGTSENIECTSGWIPGYAGALVQDITVPAPDGHELVGATIGVGATAADAVTVGRLDGSGAFSGDAEGFVEPPTVTEGGGVRFSLAQSGLEETLRRLPDFPGRACAVSQERRDEILAQYGQNPTVDAAVVTLMLTWRVVQPLDEPVRQDILAGTGSIGTVMFEPLPDDPPSIATDAAVFTTADERWGERLLDAVTVGDDDAPLTFADAGTVPTALANALVRIGVEVEPGAVADALLERGAWRPGIGTDLDAFRNAEGVLELASLAGDGAPPSVPARPASVSEALQRLGRGEVVALAGLAERGQRTVVTLVGYDAVSDVVRAIDPHTGEVEVALEAVLARLASLFLLEPAQVPEGVA